MSYVLCFNVKDFNFNHLYGSSITSLQNSSNSRVPELLRSRRLNRATVVRLSAAIFSFARRPVSSLRQIVPLLFLSNERYKFLRVNSSWLPFERRVSLCLIIFRRVSTSAFLTEASESSETPQSYSIFLQKYSSLGIPIATYL